ncbi:chromatin assembly complex protein [Mycena olivaceomarginata]|nr:chromatin assembly complex protein [Mycena olivaceomarginata]
MRFRTLEIRWHDSKPISSCDFQPIPFKKARPSGGDPRAFASQAYRLATAGEDNHVRVWMVHPNIRPAELEVDSKDAGAPRPARVEYLATLSRHSAAVNVVRFSPNGEFIASAGDDGMVIIWAPSATPQTSTYGSDLSADDLPAREGVLEAADHVYDLAWSPTGEYLLTGSTDNCARVFASADGKCMHEIAEHSHYVQGVAWDPLNEYIATQSSDRSMHVYRINTSKGTFEAHAIGRNTRFPVHHARDRAHSRTPSVHREELSLQPRPPPQHQHRDADAHALGAGTSAVGGRDSAMFPPPPAGSSSRRSSFSGSNAPSSPSGFSAVSGFSRYGRSPSPMPALPAIRTPPSASAGWAGRYEERTASRERGRSTSSRYDERGGWPSDDRNGPNARLDEQRGRYGYDERRHTDGARLYGDESFSNFFRRLAFSPDGALLLTPAGTFEDPSATVVGWEGGAEKGESGSGEGKTTPAASTSATPGEDCLCPLARAQGAPRSNSSVYIYSRANFARPPVAQLPGHKKASVAVKFSPVLFELRPNVAGGASSAGHQGGEPRIGTGTATGEEGDAEHVRDVEENMEVDLVGPLSLPPPPAPNNAGGSGSGSGQGIAAPAPQRSFDVLASPALSPIDSNARRPPTPAASKPGTPVPGYTASASVTPNTASVTPNIAPGTGSVFALPYRMLYAVVTMDTVAIYDTQQAGPVCLLTKLHYDEFTDLTWSPDGQCLMLSSRDGYCTLVTFDEILATHHTQQAALQLQQIAAQHSVPISYAPSSSSQSGSGRKRPHEPLTPAASVDGDATSTPMSSLPASASAASVASFVSDATDATEAGPSAGEEAGADGPPKKKRRVALTRVGDI